MATINALLQCGHVVTVRVRSTSFLPAENCPVCREWVDVEKYYSKEWHTKCRVCKFSRKHGAAKVYAERAAARHYVATGHETAILYYSDAPATLPSAVNVHVQEVLPIEPPF